MQETATKNKLIPELKIEGDLVNLVHAPSLQLAADYIATEIPNLLNIGNIKHHEICILVRKDTEFSPQGAVVQAALESLGLDVTMVKEKDAQRTHEILNYISEVCMDPEYYVMSISDFLEKGCYLNLINMPEGLTPVILRCTSMHLWTEALSSVMKSPMKSSVPSRIMLRLEWKCRMVISRSEPSIRPKARSSKPSFYCILATELFRMEVLRTLKRSEDCSMWGLLEPGKNCT